MSRFGDDLRDSWQKEPWFDRVYRQVWPGCRLDRHRDNLAIQRRGVDVSIWPVVVPPRGLCIRTDEKFRRGTQWLEDLLVEGYHVEGSQAWLGWGFKADTLTQLLAYGYPDAGVCYLVWLCHLQAWCQARRDTLRALYGVKVSKPPGQSYETHNVPIPWGDLPQSVVWRRVECA